MRSVKNLAWQISLALGLVAPVWATDDLLTAKLIDEAHQWQQKNRYDLAANAWRKLLLAVPDHPEALSQLRIMGVQPPAKRSSTLPKPLAPAPTSTITADTNSRTKVVPAFQGSPSQSVDVTADRTVITVPMAVTQKPTQFVQSTDVPRNRKTIRSELLVAKKNSVAAPKIIAGSAPTRPAQLSQPPRDAWAQTRLELEITAENHPGSLPNMIALTRHLGTREATRHESLRQMANFARRGVVDRNMQQSWRATLMALTPAPQSQLYFARYLAYYPDDVVVRGRAQSSMMNSDEKFGTIASSTASKSTKQSAPDEPDALQSIQQTTPGSSATALRLSPSLLQEPTGTADGH